MNFIHSFKNYRKIGNFLTISTDLKKIFMKKEIVQR